MTRLKKPKAEWDYGISWARVYIGEHTYYAPKAMIEYYKHLGREEVKKSMRKQIGVEG